jgi:hypothetical protein
MNYFKFSYLLVVSILLTIPARAQNIQEVFIASGALENCNKVELIQNNEFVLFNSDSSIIDSFFVQKFDTINHYLFVSITTIINKEGGVKTSKSTFECKLFKSKKTTIFAYNSPLVSFGLSFVEIQETNDTNGNKYVVKNTFKPSPILYVPKLFYKNTPSRYCSEDFGHEYFTFKEKLTSNGYILEVKAKKNEHEKFIKSPITVYTWNGRKFKK